MARKTESMMEEAARTGTDTGASAKEISDFQSVFKSDMVSYHSTLTLIYRDIAPVPGTAPGMFTPECIRSARVAFQIHMECMQLTGSSVAAQAGYIHW
jgi:hypothetical protein